MMKDMMIRYMATKPGVFYNKKDGKLYLDSTGEKAVISFPGDMVQVEFETRHPKVSHGETSFIPNNYAEAMDAMNGIYSQVFPIEY